MPYRVDGIECDTADEARALISKPKAARKVSTSAGKGIAKSWAAARALAKKEGISVAEARSKLAKAK